MKSFPFTKMHGIGNDFIVVDKDSLDDIGVEISPELIQKVCDRNFGVGSDGFLLVDHEDRRKYVYVMYNPDGSQAEMCGNGIRCYMKYLFDEHVISSTSMKVETGAGMLDLEIEGDVITVDMGKPTPIPEMLFQSRVLGDRFPIKAYEREFVFIPVSMGNPHAVICLKTGQLEDFDIERYGSAIENDTEIFPNKTNVEFVEIVSNREINMRVWERGAAETLACGTGACASVVAAILAGKLVAGEFIKVNLKGGVLEVKRGGAKKDPVIMRGPATKVFDGVYYIEQEE